MNEALGISVTNMCYQCYALNELCPDCLEAKEIRDIQNAHQIVDEHSDYYFRGYGKNKTAVASAGSLGEPSPLSSLRDETSGHDWVGAVTRLLRPYRAVDGTIVNERYEFLPLSVT